MMHPLENHVRYRDANLCQLLLTRNVNLGRIPVVGKLGSFGRPGDTNELR